MTTRALVLALLLAPMAASGMDISPGEDVLLRAVLEGRVAAAASNGYDAREYLLYAVADARDVLPDQGSADAVVLLTPLERLRHTAYLQATSGAAMEPSAAAVRALYVPHEIGFRVFAHGADAGDGGFTQRFEPATLRVGTRTLVPVRIDRSTPSIGRYPLAALDRERPVGTVTYWFDAKDSPSLAQAKATLSFRDAENRIVELEVDFTTRR